MADDQNLLDAFKTALVAANKVAKDNVIETSEEFFNPFENMETQLEHLDEQEAKYNKLVDAAMTDYELQKALDGIEEARKSKANTKEIAEFSVELLQLARKVFLKV